MSVGLIIPAAIGFFSVLATIVTAAVKIGRYAQTVDELRKSVGRMGARMQRLEHRAGLDVEATGRHRIPGGGDGG